MPLIDWLRLAYRRDGMLHQQAIKKLRDYIKLTAPSTLHREIQEIPDDERDLLRILWEAGLPTNLQESVWKRLGR